MLLSHLLENSDSLLVRLVQGRLKAGESVWVNTRIRDAIGPISNAWGPLKEIWVENCSDVDSCVSIKWRQGGRIGITISDSVRADTFDDQFDLKKDVSPMADWVLTNRTQSVTEGLVDTEEPLLVTIIDQRLQAGDKVLINIEKKVRQFDGSFVTFKHDGILTGIAELAMRSPQLRQRANGNKGVSITYEKAGASKERGYKGYAELVLPVHSFDDLYTLKRGTGSNVWRLVNA